MNYKEKRPWYKNWLYVTPIIAFVIGVSLFGGESNTENLSAEPAYTATIPYGGSVNQLEKTQAISPPSTVVEKTTGLSNDNYYTNVNGNTVHSPAYSNSVPTGASARCRDGTYSFSQHRSGTCSHHGGVAQWL